ncbi:MAG: nucleotidyltransferase domain-containing protein [Deltaproteobacteria bacterium]|nr:nucleotidyltransferase domain-containing protein [Deltaproteobacteria bacterium]
MRKPPLEYKNKTEIHLLQGIFKQYPGIAAVYLFGSATSSHTHAESDLDLAIVPRTPFLPELKIEILAELVRHGFENVDLVFLNTDDIVRKYEAVRQNQIVYQTDDFDRGHYYSLIVRQYLDFMPYLQVQREAYKRRILDG